MRLQSKLLAVLLTGALIASALVLLLVRRAVDAVVVGSLQRNAIVLARAAAIDLAPGLADGRETEALRHLQVLMQVKSALYAAALDLEGRVFAHTTISRRGERDDDPLTRAAMSSSEPRSWRTDHGGEPVLVVAVPIWSPPRGAEAESFLLSSGRTRLGTLKLAVPLAPALGTVDDILRAVAAIVLAACAAALGLAFVLVRGMLAPIRRLMTGIRRVAEGRYGVAVPAVSRDELGDLARSFNAMSSELERTTVSKEYVESVLDNMYDMLIVTDEKGLIRSMNHAATEALGDGHLIGRPLAEVFASPPPPGVVRDAEVELRTQDGGRMEALYAASPLLDREGRTGGYIGVARDITARKRAEKELLAAKLAAETSARELEAFSYSVAHDLRAPLRAVDGFSQMLIDKYSGRLDEAGREFLRRVRAGSGKMSRLIDDLLDLSRITRGPLNPEPVDLSALALDIGAELRKAEPGRAVDFVVAPGLAASGDPGLLRVALVNLLGNAWKYTGRHPRARIEFGSRREAGRTVYFVRDDGAGFDMAFVKRLFQPFTRLHPTAEFEGTGIGLALVERVIVRHGGSVWGEGEVERGAVFYFTLWEGRP